MFHVKHEAWAEMAAAAGVDLDERALHLLDRYETLLRDRAIPMGMVAPSDTDRLFERHILDGLRALPHLGTARTLADAGSGGGVPGVPIAVGAPALRVTLIEPRRQRVAFLELVREELGLRHVVIRQARVRALDDRFDVVTARAFGGAAATWEATAPLLAPGGRVIYWAGERFDPDRDSPSGAVVDMVTTSGVAMSGPLAIMAPQ